MDKKNLVQFSDIQPTSGALYSFYLARVTVFKLFFYMKGYEYSGSKYMILINIDRINLKKNAICGVVVRG